MSIVPVKSESLTAAEVSWFAPLCSDDYRYLGVPDGELRSSWENTSRIVRRADELGFRNILCPSSYQVGQDTLSDPGDGSRRFGRSLAHEVCGPKGDAPEGQKSGCGSVKPEKTAEDQARSIESRGTQDQCDGEMDHHRMEGTGKE